MNTPHLVKAMFVLAAWAMASVTAHAGVTSIAVDRTPVDTTASGGSLSAHTANDINIGFTGTLGGQQLLVELTAGSIYQDGVGSDAPPLSAFFTVAPDLEFDSFLALGDLADPSVVPSFAGGATALGGASAMTFDTSKADVTWFPPGGTMITSGTDFPIARITLSDDAEGTWRVLSTTSTGNGYIAAPAVDVPGAVAGTSVDFGNGFDGVIQGGQMLVVPEPSSILLAGLALLLIGTRCGRTAITPAGA